MKLKTMRGGLVWDEEPTFKTVISDGAFQVRDYPSLIMAEVTQ